MAEGREVSCYLFDSIINCANLSHPATVSGMSFPSKPSMSISGQEVATYKLKVCLLFISYLFATDDSFLLLEKGFKKREVKSGDWPSLTIDPSLRLMIVSFTIYHHFQ